MNKVFKIYSQDEYLLLIIMFFLISISFFILAMFTFVAPAIFPGGTQLWFIIMIVFCICSVIFTKNTVNIFRSKKILLTLIMITDGYLTDFRFKSFSGYTCSLYSSNPPECYKIDCSRNNRRYCLSILVIKNDSNIKPVDYIYKNDIYFGLAEDKKAISIEMPLGFGGSKEDITNAFNLINK